VRIIARTVLILALVAAGISAMAGRMLAPQFLHPARLDYQRLTQTEDVLRRTQSTKLDFEIRAPDGVELSGWKIRPPSPNGDWVLLFHGVGDNRTGMLGPAEFLLRHGYSVVAMDARAHGQSGGAIATYGWKERYDTVAVTNALLATEPVRHLFAPGVSMGAAIALQSAAVEPRIEGVAAEGPFANLREVAYDYAGLDFSRLLGETLFRPAVIVAMHSIAEEGGFDPDDISPERAVAERPFPVLLICGAEDHRIPCRHAERIYRAAVGQKELWIVEGAGHAGALGHAPAEYERRVIKLLFESSPSVPKLTSSRTADPLPLPASFVLKARPVDYDKSSTAILGCLLPVKWNESWSDDNWAARENWMKRVAKAPSRRAASFDAGPFRSSAAIREEGRCCCEGFCWQTKICRAAGTSSAQPGVFGGLRRASCISCSRPRSQPDERRARSDGRSRWRGDHCEYE
jgi:uncharacterized protein